MSVRSKWQSLPTEAINPATLAIDKLDPADIVEGMLNEDRKMLSARSTARRSGSRSASTSSRTRSARAAASSSSGAGTSGRLGVVESAEMPPTFGTKPGSGAGDHGRRHRTPSCRPRRASRTTTRRARDRSTGCDPRRRTWSSASRRAG